jgi:hypothetical protein
VFLLSKNLDKNTLKQKLKRISCRVEVTMRKFVFVLLLALLVVCPFVVLNHPVYGDTISQSIISQNTTWTKSNSPYNLSGPTLVSTGVTLTIEAGAAVNINSYYLLVNGTLNATGTPDNPIYINGASVNAGQIQFTNSSRSWNEQTGTGCTIENAVINQTIISIQGCTVKLNGNTFNDAADMMHDNTAVTAAGGSSIISNNKFSSCGLSVSDFSSVSNNIIQGGMGIYGNPTITGNTISGGSSYFYIGRNYDRDYYTIAIEHQASPVISGNTIHGGIAFNMNGNGYLNNNFNVQITSNTIDGGIFIGEGTGNIVISSNIIPGGILSRAAATVTIENNLILNANIGLQIGDATVINNTLANNQIAIQLSAAVAPTITGNNLENYSQYSIKLSSTSSNINATGNWWGTTNQQAISQSIYNQKNDFNLGTVTLTPILNAPNPSAPPADEKQPPTSPSPSPSLIPTQNPTPTPTTSLSSTSMPSLSPTATVTIPEFPSWVLFLVAIAATFVVAAITKKKT